VAPRQQEVGDRCQAVLVGERSDELSGQRFGRNVHERPDEKACPRQTLISSCVSRRRDAEIEKLDLM
jgi:hypothetical protein